MKIIAAILLLLAGPLAAQTIAPSQIKPGANGQTIQTVGGKAAWANTAAGVTSVFGRTGDVVPVAGDYNCSQITSAVCTLPTLFNQTVSVDGAAKTQRATLNFINGSAGTVSCVDNPVTLATDCTFTGGSSTGPTYSINNVAGSRAVYGGTCSTAYQNSTANPMFVGGSIGTSGSGVGNILVAQAAACGGPYTLVPWANQATATVSGGDAGFSAVIMPGYYYIVQVSGAVNGGVRHWTEITSTGSGGGGGGGGPTLQTNGTPNGSQALLNLKAGANMTVTDDGSGGITFDASGSGGGAVLKTNGTSNTSQVLLNFTDGHGFAWTNPSGGVEEVGVDGSHYLPTTTDQTNWNAKVASVAGAAGNRAASVVTTSGAVVVTTFDQQLYASQFSTIPALVTACGSAATKITVDTAQSFTLAANATFPANCAFNFVQGGIWTTGGVFTLTFNGPVDLNPSPHFAGAATVAGLRGGVPAEAFGVAQPYTSVTAAAAGSDDTAKAALAIAAITQGGWVQFRCGYYHINTMAFTGSVNGAKGLCHGYSYPSASLTTVIVSNSATAPMVTFGNGSAQPTTVWNVLEDIAFQRSVHPTGSTSVGLSVDNAGGLYAKNVKVEDSLPLVYLHMAPSYGFGLYALSGDWGESVVAASAYAADTPKGFYIDSADGNEENSLNIVDSSVNCGPLNGTGAVTTGYLITGENISDVNVENGAIAECGYGARVTYTGSTSGLANNVRFDNLVVDHSPINSALIENVRAQAFGTGGAITFNGGEFDVDDAATCNIDVENSLGVNFVGGAQVVGSISSCINDSSDIQFKEDQFNHVGAIGNIPALIFGGTANSSVSSTFTSTSTSSISQTDIEFTNSSAQNVVDGSTFSLGAAVAIGCDGTSGSNVIGTNSYDPAVVMKTSGCGNAGQFLTGDGLYKNTIPTLVLTSGTTGTYTGNGINTGGNDYTISALSANLFLAPVSGAEVVRVPAGNTFELGALSGCLSADATTHIVTGSGSVCGSGSGITFPQTVSGTVNSGGLLYANSGTQISVSAAGTAGQVVLWGGGGTAPGAQTIGTSGAAIPLLNTAVTFSGAAAASAPSLNLMGTLFTGGSGTTTVPFDYINNGASGPTSFNTSGTEFGINAPSGFAGNFLDFHINGVASIFSVGSNGAITSRSISTNGGAAQISSVGLVQGTTFGTLTNCGSAASPAVCGSAAAGVFTIAAGATTVTVNTTAVTANSEINIQPDSSLGTRLGVTCNTALSTVTGPVVTARTTGTSFTVSIPGTLATNPACYSYSIVN